MNRNEVPNIRNDTAIAPLVLSIGIAHGLLVLWVSSSGSEQYHIKNLFSKNTVFMIIVCREIMTEKET